MCGRYALFSPMERIAAMFGIASVSLPTALTRPRFNFAPGQSIVVVRMRPGGRGRELAPVTWGFAPRWRGGEVASSGRSAPINARSESAAGSSMFGDALAHRRCLVPVDAFYEWKLVGGSKTGHSSPTKQPYAIRARDHRPFALAGIWEADAPPESGATGTAAILTRAPSPLLAEIHDRAPVVVAPVDWERWLDPKLRDGEAAIARLSPETDVPLEAFAVSRRVNSPDIDDAGCLAPQTAERSLFGET